MAWFAAKGLPPPMEWPAHSPDLSPIENLWGLLVRDVNQRNPRTVEQLRTAIRRSWRARTADGALLKSLLGGWKGRITDMVAAKGGRICY